ncbi:PLP-dependent aminotransferase family protein [Stappia stellulata]|uniref:aminotransferase-like domain-containing protein n=1 Tax=Stappia stellulata TaxID=71235 RepID=UPI000685C79E|nr:PLP-dependent aminotransferase family protein [Stappia stellulata]
MSIWLPKLDGRRGAKYQRIVEALAEDIASGRLPPGTRLPPYRELAYRLAVSAQTVSRAYTQATRRGLLRGETGRGTFVADPSEGAASTPPPSLTRDTSGPVDLSRNLPSPSRADGPLREALREIGAASDLRMFLDYQSGNGTRRDHDAAARSWLQECGLTAAGGEVIGTCGAQHGLFCALTALLSPGDVMLTEALGYAPVRVVAERLALRILPVEIDTEGVCPESLERICRERPVRLLYLTPTLQSPTTATLSEGRRRRLAEIARRHDMLILEDDVFGPLKEDRPPPIAQFAPERTIYVTSLSKSVAPGLRIGFVHAPSALATAVRRAVVLSVWMTPPLMDEIAVRLIRSGAALRLLQEQRATAHRRQVLARRILGRFDLHADPQGLHAWLRLPDGWTAGSFRTAAEERGVLVSDARDFAATGVDAPAAARLSLGHEPADHRLKTGLARLADLLSRPPQSDVLFL